MPKSRLTLVSPLVFSASRVACLPQASVYSTAVSWMQDILWRSVNDPRRSIQRFRPFVFFCFLFLLLRTSSLSATLFQPSFLVLLLSPVFSLLVVTQRLLAAASTRLREGADAVAILADALDYDAATSPRVAAAAAAQLPFLRAVAADLERGGQAAQAVCPTKLFAATAEDEGGHGNMIEAIETGSKDRHHRIAEEQGVAIGKSLCRKGEGEKNGGREKLQSAAWSGCCGIVPLCAKYSCAGRRRAIGSPIRHPISLASPFFRLPLLVHSRGLSTSRASMRLRDSSAIRRRFAFLSTRTSSASPTHVPRGGAHLRHPSPPVRGMRRGKKAQDKRRKG